MLVSFGMLPHTSSAGIDKLVDCAENNLIGGAHCMDLTTSVCADLSVVKSMSALT